MQDELYKPLGKPQRHGNRVARWQAAAAIAMLLGGGGGGWLLSQHLVPGSKVVSDRPDMLVTSGTSAESTRTEEAESRRDLSDIGLASQDDLPVAGDGIQALEELEPTGSMEVAIPVPAPRRQEAGLAHLPDPELVEKGAAGPLPRRGPDGRRPMDVYSRQPATEGNFGVARVVLIVGGMGISQTSSQMAVNRLPPAVTLAFAPTGNSLLRWMQEARKRGHEILLQVPMEPFGYPQNDPGRNTLLVEAGEPVNLENLHWALGRLTNYVGVMNFLGGRFLADSGAMKPVFDELARRGLLFVDDGTSRGSQTEAVAAASLLPHARAHVQLDSTRTRQEISRKLEELAAEAKRTGIAIGIASAFPESIELIAAFAQAAAARGIEITPVSAIVTDPDRKEG